MTDAGDMDEHIDGVEIPEIYDGVSVWIADDGRYINRWADPVYPQGEPVIVRRRAATDAWIKRAGGRS